MLIRCLCARRPIFFDPEAEAEKRRAREESLKAARAASAAVAATGSRAAAEEEDRAARKIKCVAVGSFVWEAWRLGEHKIATHTASCTNDKYSCVV